MSRGKGAQTLRLIEASRAFLELNQPASVRAVCYQLFTQNLIPNMKKSATNTVSRLLARAREEGLIPWEWIVDESREAERVPMWNSTEALINAAVSQYRRNYWQDQMYRVEVWSEKGTVRGTLGPVLREYGVTFRVMHGYASATVINDVAELSSAIGDTPYIVLYVGDWDPSGLHMSNVDLPNRLLDYGAEIQLERIALLESDLAGLPSFDAQTKRHDPRYRWFKDNFGGSCYELDAMPPIEMRQRLETFIRSFIDIDAWDQARMVETAEVASMKEFSKSWQASICADGDTP